MSDEFVLVVADVGVLIKRNGRFVVDPLGHPINFWVVEAAEQAIDRLRRSDPYPGSTVSVSVE